MSYKARAQRIREAVRLPDILRVLGLETGPMLSCLWHTEDEPSLKVYSNGLHCFGSCRRNYSAIDLVMHVYNLDFKDAVEWIETTFGLAGDLPVQILLESQEDDTVFWQMAEKEVIGLLRPYLVQVPHEVYLAMKDDLWGAYLAWDEAAEVAREVGDSPTKTLQKVQPIREALRRKLTQVLEELG